MRKWHIPYCQERRVHNLGWQSRKFDDVVDPPLPQVSSSNGSTADPAAGPVKAPRSSGRANAANMGLLSIGNSAD
ncbi:hypothetical protein PVL29_014548 [Vitis rotundifolia]|uniref:Uncharacterized protein n=1 Tax=Vitis rotundifolia TaxID=103349 RepID=A0AA39DMI0_VITRO|nr:hypothetical protein PVL29_014548 [Vitis rotundifolia]